jgi:hypothetical protein
MVEHRLTDIEDPAIQILGQLANYGTKDKPTSTSRLTSTPVADVQADLIQRGLVKKLISLMKSRKQETSSGATLAMLSILPHRKFFSWLTFLSLMNYL